MPYITELAQYTGVPSSDMQAFLEDLDCIPGTSERRLKIEGAIPCPT